MRAHRVHVLDIDNDARWAEMIVFCEDTSRPGMYDWDPEDSEVGDRQDADFYFSDENVAFDFKMRFG
jgi:hypothetical protein